MGETGVYHITVDFHIFNIFTQLIGPAAAFQNKKEMLVKSLSMKNHIYDHWSSFIVPLWLAVSERRPAFHSFVTLTGLLKMSGRNEKCYYSVETSDCWCLRGQLVTKKWPKFHIANVEGISACQF